MNELKEVLKVLPLELYKQFVKENPDIKGLEEIRLRVGQPLRMIVNNREVLSKDKTIIMREHINESLEYISGYSLYAFENQMKAGYITIQGGHRVGLCGKLVLDEGKVKNIRHIHSLNIRVARQVIGSANGCIDYIRTDEKVHNTLIIAPPRCGKTTILRDIIRQLSKGNERMKGLNVGVIDERSEIAACYGGVPQNNLGPRTDVLDGAGKADGTLMLLRSMSPSVIAMDELGAKDDISALEYCVSSGCVIIATIHGTSYQELKSNIHLGKLVENKMFTRFIILENKNSTGEVVEVLGENGQSLLS